LIGKTYVEYFATRYGPHAADWKPASARPNYERYLPPGFPSGYSRICTINLTAGDGRWPIGQLLKQGADHYLIFRGTAADDEWIKDILLMQTPCAIDTGEAIADPGQVHLGFASMYNSLEPKPPEWATRIAATTGRLHFSKRAPGKLFIAGHSLGGALGTLASLDLHRLEPVLYTFGSPRVGDPRFQTAFERLVPRAVRIANHFDPIANLPDETVDLVFRKYAYRHVGQEHRVFALSQADGPSLPRIISAHRGWREWKDYVFQKLLKRASEYRLDPLFAHQLRTYEYALGRDQR
jgi:hypothetical protein